MKAVVLAATRGNNLGPLTDARPKAMSVVGGRPLLEYHLRDLASSGVSEVNIVTGHGAPTIRNAYGNGDPLNLQLNYRHQHFQSGIGSALLTCKDHFTREDYLILVYADHFTVESLVGRALQVFHAVGGPTAVVALTGENESCGNVFLGEHGRIEKFVEKPVDGSLGNYVFAGVFILPTAIFRYLEECNGRMEDAFELLIQRDSLHACIHDGDWQDIDFPWSLLKANQAAMETHEEARIARDVEIEGGVRITGPVIIESGVTIKAGSIIQGPCFIGQDSFIGNNTLIREYTSIGPNCIIGYGVELKNCIFFGQTTLGRLSFVGDSIVGRGVKLGSGVMTVNETETQDEIHLVLDKESICSRNRKLGSFIGDEAIVGAANTLGPGTVIPAGARIPHNVTYTRTDL